MEINRVWAMTSCHTFTIKPIAKLVAKYVGDGIGWIDPFAGENSPAEFTNDLNHDKPAKYHLHAKDFSAQLDGLYNGCLFDPPYSLTQVKECYNSIGIDLMSKDDATIFPSNVKNSLSNKIKENGYVLCFGWNTIGFGKKRGFELIEILLVCHG